MAIAYIIVSYYYWFTTPSFSSFVASSPLDLHAKRAKQASLLTDEQIQWEPLVTDQKVNVFFEKSAR
jgi:hypothetical protein